MLHEQVWQDTHSWASKGNKKNRAKKRRMMFNFAAHAEFSGARNSGQVGRITVIKFWKHQRIEKKLSWATQMNYWQAIRDLWRLWEKSGEPPRPRDPTQGTVDN